MLQRRGKRKPIPESLRRERIEYRLPDEQLVDPKTGQVSLKKIGEVVREQLAFQTPEVYVEQHVRFKYARVQENLSGNASDTEVVIAPAPKRGIAKSIAAPSLLAQVAVSKHADHLPLYRLERILKRSKVDLSRSSMSRWIQDVAELCQPLLTLMKQRLLEHNQVLHHDDTPVKQQAPGTGSTQQAYFWSCVGQEHSEAYYVLLDYTQGRHAAGPEAWFRDTTTQEALFVGKELMTDAYAGYNGLVDPQNDWNMTSLHCWAHVRRKFFDCQTTSPTAAQQALSFIQKLYAVERQWNDATMPFSEAQIVERRQSQAKSIVHDFFEFCRKQYPMLLPNSSIAKAIAYALNQEAPLRRYLEAGYRPIDNNLCERTIRPLAIGRKNWLFIGSPKAGKAAASIFSLIASANMHNLDLLAYMTDVITHLPATAEHDVERFLPDRWISPQS